MNKVIGILIYVLFTVFMLAMAFLLIDQQIEDGISVVKIWQQIKQFAAAHDVELIIFVSLLICFIVLIKARDYVMLEEARYHAIIRDYEVRLAQQNFALENERFYKERALKNLDEMTEHYNQLIEKEQENKEVN